MNLQKITILLIVLLLASAPPSFGVDRGNLLFYLTFEGDILPAIAGGKVGPGTTKIQFQEGSEKDVVLVPGLRGQGLRVKKKDMFIQYLTKESFSLKEGTVAFWIKPVGWSGIRNGQAFLYVRSDQVALHFYIYPGNLYYYFDGPGKYYLIPTAEDGNQKDPFKDGEWTFLAGTFKPGEQTFYVNGHLMNTLKDGLLEPVFSRKGIVEIPAGDKVLDEIMIFDRVLIATEIKAIYRANAT